MNEDATISANPQDPSDAGGGDPTPATAATAVSGECPSDQGTEPCHPDQEVALPSGEAVPLFADPDADPDPDPRAAPEAERLTPLDDLRQQLTALREELDALRSKPTRAEPASLLDDEFRALYPEVTPDALPDGVRADILRGVPPAAAYALSERRRALREAEADRASREAALRSAGSLGGVAVTYFTPAEVKAMTPSEVRKNFSVILSSMKKWQ